jgi:hypothetical protein
MARFVEAQMRRMVFAAALLLVSSAGCNSEDVSGIGGLVFEATSSVSPAASRNVIVTATITNISSGELQVNYAGCGLIAVLHSGSLDGPVVYDPSPSLSCAPAPFTKTLAAGESFQVTGAVTPDLAPGTYYVEAVLGVNGERTSTAAGVVNF